MHVTVQWYVLQHVKIDEKKGREVKDESLEWP